MTRGHAADNVTQPIRHSLGATVVTFIRSENGKLPRTKKTEIGIAITRDTGTSNILAIYDMDGEPVKNVWSYSMQQHEGCFMLHVEEAR